MVGKRITDKLQNEKLNICFIAPVPPPCGGIANWTSLMCRYLDQKCENFIRYVVLNTAPKIGVTEGRSIWDRIVGGGLDMLCQRKNLKKMLISDKIDVIHMTTSGSLSVIRDFMLSRVAERFNVPIVYHIHFGRIPEIRETNNWEWKITQSILESVDQIIAIDKKTHDALYNMYGKKISYIPNPIDIEELPKREENSEKIVMYLGWVIKEKGIEELLQAWAQVYPVHGDWKLRIVGPYREEYYEYLNKNFDTDGVEFWGEQPHDIAMNLLNKASIFVLPSYTEGCPYVIMEAMALGKAVIGTNVGNIPEMLSGECGIIIDPSDNKCIEDALHLLISNKSDRIALEKNALKKTRAEYVIDRVMGIYESCWQRVH